MRSQAAGLLEYYRDFVFNVAPDWLTREGKEVSAVRPQLLAVRYVINYDDALVLLRL